jgi:hypothetical protein
MMLPAITVSRVALVERLANKLAMSPSPFLRTFESARHSSAQGSCP